ncbi:MAG: TIGR04222 domain-containing membrane protein [Nevskia sp.]|nr:TIGR04222 domain-containing membrane protein [Nevskia sp.]
MNPFDLRGPAFLLFYFVGAAALLGYCWWRVRLRGDGLTPLLSGLTEDPYRIAFLRGGEVELVLVAVFNLVDRGLLLSVGNKLGRGRGDAAGSLRRALDQALIRACTGHETPHQLCRDAAVRAACESYARDLERRGLMADAQERGARRWLCVLVLAALIGVAWIKIELAVRRGHSNYGFLIVLAAFASIAALSICLRNRTRRGDEALSGLRTLMRRLRGRAGELLSGGATNEALLLASVFGISALAGPSFGFIGQLFPQAGKRGGDGGSSCSSSSCGSSGCGGGGGCGGCGS